MAEPRVPKLPVSCFNGPFASMPANPQSVMSLPVHRYRYIHRRPLLTSKQSKNLKIYSKVVKFDLF